jgi:hypothetical protein
MQFNSVINLLLQQNVEQLAAVGLPSGVGWEGYCDVCSAPANVYTGV